MQLGKFHAASYLLLYLPLSILLCYPYYFCPCDRCMLLNNTLVVYAQSFSVHHFCNSQNKFVCLHGQQCNLTTVHSSIQNWPNTSKSKVNACTLFKDEIWQFYNLCYVVTWSTALYGTFLMLNVSLQPELVVIVCHSVFSYTCFARFNFSVTYLSFCTALCSTYICIKNLPSISKFASSQYRK